MPSHLLLVLLLALCSVECPSKDATAVFEPFAWGPIYGELRSKGKGSGRDIWGEHADTKARTKCFLEMIRRLH
jgi:hypothetical protein